MYVYVKLLFSLAYFQTFGLVSKNPVMPKNITDYLVDEGSYEEEAYLGQYHAGYSVHFACQCARLGIILKSCT